MLCVSTASECPVLVLLLDETVVFVSRDFLVLVFFLQLGELVLSRGDGLASANPIAVAVALVLMMAGSTGFVRDLVLRFGSVGLNTSLAAACHILRFLIAFSDCNGVISEWCVGGRRTLVHTCVRTLGTGCIRSVIDCVLRRSSLLVAGCTLGAAGVCVALGWSDA